MHIRPSWLIGVTTAIVISIVASLYLQRDNLIAGCIRNSSFKNTEALAWEQASSAREKDGDKETALVYRNTAYDIRLTIPVPKEKEYDLPRGLIEADREQGCAEAHPPPIPFVE